MTLDDVEEAFESCLALQEGAAEGLQRFLTLLRAEYAKTGLKYVRDDVWLPDFTIHRLTTAAKPSIALRRLAYYVLNDCRHALDQAVVASSRMLGTPHNRNNVYFPFSEDESDFENLFERKGRCRDTAPVLVPELKNMRPWWGGDDKLRTLGKLSGPNKHQVIIDFAPEVIMYENREISLPQGGHICVPPKRADLTDLSGFGLRLEPVRGRTDFIIAVVRKEHAHVVELDGAGAAFCAKQATRLAYRPIDRLMSDFADTTASIIGRIKSFTVEQVVT